MDALNQVLIELRCGHFVRTEVHDRKERVADIFNSQRIKYVVRKGDVR